MTVIAVINQKGGSGKSVLATHLAVWLAKAGHSVMLGDVDRQQSSLGWIKARGDCTPHVLPWAMHKSSVLQVPTGVSQVILDTPSGLHGYELARVIQASHAVIIPVCESAFDRQAAKACVEELRKLPRIQQQRCKLAMMGMRINLNIKEQDQMVRDLAQQLDVPYLGFIRNSAKYVDLIERGQCLFDLPPERVGADMQQWQPLLTWVQSIIVDKTKAPSSHAAVPHNVPTPAWSSHAISTAPSVSTYGEASSIPIPQNSALTNPSPQPSARLKSHPLATSTSTSLISRLAIPSFFRRK